MPPWAHRVVVGLLTASLLIHPAWASGIHFAACITPLSSRTVAFGQMALAPQPALSQNVIAGTEQRAGFAYRRGVPGLEKGYRRAFSVQWLTAGLFIGLLGTSPAVVPRGLDHQAISWPVSAVVLSAQGSIQPSETIDQRAYRVARTTLNNIRDQKMGRLSKEERRDVIALLESVIRERRIRFDSSSYFAAYVETRQKQYWIAMNPEIIGGFRDEDLESVVAHEAYHDVPFQIDRRDSGAVEYQRFYQASNAGRNQLVVATNRSAQADFESAVAKSVVGEFEAKRFELSYQVDRAIGLGYTNLGAYFDIMGAGHPGRKSTFEAFKAALRSIDLRTPEQVVFDEDKLLRTVFRASVTDKLIPLEIVALIAGGQDSFKTADPSHFADDLLNWALTWIKPLGRYRPEAPRLPAPSLAYTILGMVSAVLSALAVGSMGWQTSRNRLAQSQAEWTQLEKELRDRLPAGVKADLIRNLSDSKSFIAILRMHRVKGDLAKLRQRILQAGAAARADQTPVWIKWIPWTFVIGAAVTGVLFLRYILARYDIHAMWPLQLSHHTKYSLSLFAAA